jgi:hypothetical protein
LLLVIIWGFGFGLGDGFGIGDAFWMRGRVMRLLLSLSLLLLCKAATSQPALHFQRAPLWMCRMLCCLAKGMHPKKDCIARPPAAAAGAFAAARAHTAARRSPARQAHYIHTLTPSGADTFIAIFNMVCYQCAAFYS